MPVFIDGVRANKPSEKRVLQSRVIFRVTPRANIHHDVVFNLGDCAERLGLSLILQEKQAW